MNRKNRNRPHSFVVVFLLVALVAIAVKSEQIKLTEEDLLIFLDIFMGFPEKPALKDVKTIAVSVNGLNDISDLKISGDDIKSEIKTALKNKLPKTAIEEKSKIIFSLVLNSEKIDDDLFYFTVKLELSYYDRVIYPSWTDPESKRIAKIVLWEGEDGFMAQENNYFDILKTSLNDLLDQFSKEWHKDNS